MSTSWSRARIRASNAALLSQASGSRDSDAVHHRHLEFFHHPMGSRRALRRGARVAAGNHGQLATCVRAGSARVGAIHALLAWSGPRRFRALVQVQGFHRARADRTGPARDARARHARARGRARGRYSPRHPRRTAPALRDGLSSGIARGARYCGTAVRRVAAARPHIRHRAPLAAGRRLGAGVDPLSGVAHHRSDRYRRSPTSRGSRAAECSRR